MTGLPGDWSSRRRATFLRDDFQCQHCGVVGGHLGAADLECHHVVPRRMDGIHDLENLLTLCSECHTELHSADDVDCVRAGAGPTAVGATFESLPGPLGPWLARVVDGVAVAVMVAVGASVLTLSIPELTLAETFAPVWTVLTEALQADAVALTWIASVICVDLLFACQPLIRRLSPEAVPGPPIGTWRQWLLGGSGVTAVALGGLLFEVSVVLGPSVSITPQSWVMSYALGGGIVVVAAGAAVVGTESPAGPTVRWRRLCIVLGGGVVAATALLASTEPVPGLAVLVALGFVAARHWTPVD